MLIIAGSIFGETTVWAYYKLKPNGPAWLMIIITSLVTAAGVTLVMLGMQYVSGGYISVTAGPIFILYGYVLVISTAMTLLGYTLSKAFNMAGPDFAHSGPQLPTIRTDSRTDTHTVRKALESTE